MCDDLTVHDSSGNIFDDMGMPDADTRLAKAEIARGIRIAVRERNLSTAGAAEHLGISLPELSDLLRGRFAEFSVEQLEALLSRLRGENNEGTRRGSSALF